MTEKLTPFPSQEVKIERIRNEPTRAVLLADEMSKGKTLMSTEVILRSGFKRGLIVGVKDTADQWAERIEAQSDGTRHLRVIDATKGGKQAFDDFIAGADGLFFAGSEYLRAQDWFHVPVLDGTGRRMVKHKKSGDPYLTKGKGIGPAFLPVFDSTAVQKHLYGKVKALDVLVYDEVHVVSNKKSRGIQTIRTLKADFKIGMSGTFYGNKFKGAWAICQWLWPEVIDKSSIRWEADWCEKKTVYVPGGVSRELIMGEKHPGEFVKTLPCYIRDDDFEIAPEPELFFVQLTPKQRAQYETLERDLVLWLQTHSHRQATTEAELEALVADLPIVLRSRLRTAALGEMSFNADGEIDFGPDAVSSKLNAIAQIIDRPSWRGKQVAIYTDSKKFVKLAVARLNRAGYSAREWSGDVSSKNRAEIKRAWLAGEFQYLVSVIAAFSTGLDGFQTVCSDLIWASESEDNKANAQALARYFRYGRKGEFRHVKILAEGTHDVGIYSRLVAHAAGVQQSLKAA